MNISDIKKNESFYILNKTSGHFMLVIQVPGNSSSTAIEIPLSAKPIDVTQFAPSEYFKNSMDFRNAVRKGAIEILSKEEVESKGLQAFEDNIDNINPSALPQQVSDETIEDNLFKYADERGVSDKIRDITIRDDIDDLEKTSILEEEFVQGNVTNKELEFLLTVFVEKSKVHKWAAKKLGIIKKTKKIKPKTKTKIKKIKKVKK